MAEHGFWSYAQRDPSQLALVTPEEKTLSRGELFALQNQIAHGLRALGLRHGDAVAVALPNCAEFFALNLACAQSGWSLVPINWHLAPAEIAYIVQDSEAKAFIASERIADTCRAAADEIGFPATGRFAIGAIPGFRPFAELVQGQPTTLPSERAARPERLPGSSTVPAVPKVASTLPVDDSRVNTISVWNSGT